MISNQIKQGLNKEFMMIWRSFRLGGIILAFIGVSVYYPLNAKLSDELFKNMNMGGEFMGVSMEELTAQFRDPFAMTLSSLSALAVIIALILLSASAGGEQKKRSIIMPQTAGLTPAGYVAPKFILYPVLMFLVTLLSAFVTDAVCYLLTHIDRAFGDVLLAGTMTGAYMMFTVCFYMFLGISTVQPGLSVLYVYAANNMIIPLISGIFGVDKFTPWSLDIMVTNMMSSPGGIKTVGEGNIAVTIAITLLLSAGLAFAALFAVSAKRTDNTIDEVY